MIDELYRRSGMIRELPFLELWDTVAVTDKENGHYIENGHDLALLCVIVRGRTSYRSRVKGYAGPTYPDAVGTSWHWTIVTILPERSVRIDSSSRHSMRHATRW